MSDSATTRLLLGDKLAPITSEFGFVDASLESVVDCFINWQRPIQERRKVELRRQSVAGGLEEVLRSLTPLSSVEARRYLFVPTDSTWVAFFDNNAHGTDASSVMSVISRLLACRTLRIASVPETQRGNGRSSRGRFGAEIFELYSPEGGDLRNMRRSIALVNDSGEWVFETLGEPLFFEEQSGYQHRDVRSRFDRDRLITYAQELEVRPFDETFYRPQRAVLVEKVGKKAPGETEISLDEARSRY